MDSKEKDRKHIEELKANFKIEERYKNLMIQIQDVLEALDLLDQVDVNPDLLGQAVLNYFEDIYRLKEFQDIKRTNVEKIYAYETFWLLRDKPIQIKEGKMAYEYLYINEKVFTVLLISKMLREMKVDIDSNNPRLMQFLELLYYNFKYRTFTQQSLELMVSAFFCGCKF